LSGIAAIIRFDGRPIELGAIEAMTEAMAYRGPDGISHWRRGSVALGHLMLHTTAESLEEVQPLANEDESLVLTMDGWISNWEELRSDLMARGARLRTRSDAELVLRAYETWGEDCPARIDGEFAFVIWDAGRREAFCANDHAGLRPLHYHRDQTQLIVASDIAGVLAGPGVPARINAGMVDEFVAAEWYSVDETLWQDVSRLPPAHRLRVTKARSERSRFWLPPLEASIRYDSEAEYIAHYSDLFTDCVRRASRTHLPLACEVSGGLDSSAVFAAARKLLHERQLAAPSLGGYSLVFDPSHTQASEAEFLRDVAEYWEADIKQIPAFFPDLTWFEQRGRADRDIPPYPNGAMQVSLFDAAVSDGCRVILNGHGGDEWLDGSQWYYAEQLRAREWNELFSAFRQDVEEAGLYQAARWLARYGFGQLVPGPALTLRRTWAEQLKRQRRRYLAHMAPEAKRRLRDRRNSNDQALVESITNKARQRMARILLDPYNCLTRGRNSVLSARSGYEPRTPMYARAFIEFAFSVPERLRRHGNVRKHIHREAMAGLLPESVVGRTTKAEFSSTFYPPLAAMERQLLRSRSERAINSVDSDGVRLLYSQCNGQPALANWQLWGIFGCDLLTGEQANGFWETDE
jgi:asparagine synthase (glutamine-hydrolysing)